MKTTEYMQQLFAQGNGKTVASFALIATVTGLALWTTASGGVAAPEAMKNERYEAVPVQVERAKPSAVIGGTVVPFKEVTLTAQIPGTVEFVLGKEGTEAEPGQVLVAINDDALRSERQAAVAQYYAAQSAYQNAQAQLQRELYSPQVNRGMTGMGMPGMFDRMFTRPLENMMGQTHTGVSRYADLQARQQGVNQALQQIKAARAKIDVIDTKIRNAAQVAPFKGVIIKKFVEKGDTVQPGQPLVKFGQIDLWQIQADVPVRLVSNLYIGQKIQAKLDSMPYPIDAYVRLIHPTADLKRHTVTVKFDLPRTMRAGPGAPEQRIPGGPGMYAEVRLPDPQASQGEIVSVPKDAIVQRGSLPGVYVQRPDGSWGFRLVRIGTELSGGRVQILSGLNGDEKVRVPRRPRAANHTQGRGWTGGLATR